VTQNFGAMPTVHTVDDPADPRIVDFVALNDPDLRRLREQGDGTDGGFLVAEGVLVIQQLLRSPYRLRSLLVTERGLRLLAAELAAIDSPVFVAPQPVLDAICGFHFHRGALAAADRRPLPDLAAATADADLTVIIEGVNDHENLGALFRNAAAFGTGAVVLDPTCADPLYRRSIRVSMGHVLRTPFTRAVAWPAAIAELQALGFEVLALTPSAGAEDVRDVPPVAPGRRLALLVGAEAPGLSAAALAAADRRVRIAMVPGVDSLNVATAAAVALHQLAPESSRAR
jgi:tRNA G18 (ribose-2'-O)-methylase SpoU